MIPNKPLMILMAGILLAAPGCSGTRLRNLVTRSDYMSLEELEAEDAAAETAVADAEDSGSSEQLASSEQELSEDDATAGQEKKKSRFSFAALLGRSSDKSELGTDPFVDIEEANDADAGELVAADVSAVEAEAAAVVAPAEETTEKYTATLTDVEDQAEDMFDRLAAVDAAAAAKEQVKLPEISPAAEPAASGQESFADFIAQHQNKPALLPTEEELPSPTDTASEVTEENPFGLETAEPVIAAMQDAKDPSDFDQLFPDESIVAETALPESAAQDAFASELFPELDALMAETEAEPSGIQSSEPSAEGTGADFPIPAPAGSETEGSNVDPFQLAARQHGFAAVKQVDPWAAFTEADADVTLDSAAVKGLRAADAEGFVWGQKPQPSQPEMLPAEAVTTAAAEPEALAASPVFHQVSSADATANVAGGAQLSTDFSAGLTIPTSSAPQPVPNESFEKFAETTMHSESRSAAAEDASGPADFEDVFDLKMETATPAARTGSSVNPASGLSTRTWIFLVGFAVVAYLLFAPARQNRPRA